MAKSTRDSSIDNTDEDTGGSSSENETEIAANKRLKLQGKEEDRISDLPDSLIQHILSFLPSTKQAIQTSILSKRWQDQWTRVPVLIFKSPGTLSIKYDEDLARFIDNTLLLYECSRMKKLHIAYDFAVDINFTSKIRSATKRYVEELILYFNHYDDPDARYVLPKFIFDNVSFVDLKLLNCELSWSMNWPSLKVLEMNSCFLGDKLSIENVLSCSPSLESLEIINFICWNSVIIASKSLKILILTNIRFKDEIEISCPNLEELAVRNADVEDKTILDVLSGNPSLRSLELTECFFQQLVIASKSLRKLWLSGISRNCSIEISCPNLERLDLYCWDVEKCKFTNLPSSSCASLDFLSTLPLEGCAKTMVRKILKELQAFKEVEVGNWFIKTLSYVEVGGLSCPLLNIKCLTLDFPKLKHISGIGNALRYSPALERLVINFGDFKRRKLEDIDLNNFKETCWNSNGSVPTCLVSHLKIVKIIGLSVRDGQCNVVLGFLAFVLKNARVLEKVVVKLGDAGAGFLDKVSRKLLGFPRCCPHVIVELL